MMRIAAPLDFLRKAQSYVPQLIHGSLPAFLVARVAAIGFPEQPAHKPCSRNIQ